MLPELYESDAMILRQPQGMFPTEQEAIQLLPAGVPIDPWSMWITGRPSSIIIGSPGKHSVRASYVRVVFDVTIQSDALYDIEIDGSEWPMAIVQLPPSMIVAHVAVGTMVGAELHPSVDRFMKGFITFDISRVKRLMDRVVGAPLVA